MGQDRTANAQLEHKWWQRSTKQSTLVSRQTLQRFSLLQKEWETLDVAAETGDPESFDDLRDGEELKHGSEVNKTSDEGGHVIVKPSVLLLESSTASLFPSLASSSSNTASTDVNSVPSRSNFCLTNSQVIVELKPSFTTSTIAFFCIASLTSKSSASSLRRRECERKTSFTLICPLRRFTNSHL